MKTLCIYHSKDLDGICSGAIMQLALPGATMYPYDYGQPFDLGLIDEETTVYMADVSMPMPVMEEIAKRSMCFTWIDHHKTTKDDFQKAPGTLIGLVLAHGQPSPDTSFLKVFSSLGDWI